MGAKSLIALIAVWFSMKKFLVLAIFLAATVAAQSDLSTGGLLAHINADLDADAADEPWGQLEDTLISDSNGEKTGKSLVPDLHANAADTPEKQTEEVEFI